MKNKFLLREIAGEFLLIPLGSSSKQFNSIITMNETGAFIWRLLEKGMSVQEVARALTEDYDVSFDTAVSDNDKFINELQRKYIL